MITTEMINNLYKINIENEHILTSNKIENLLATAPETSFKYLYIYNTFIDKLIDINDDTVKVSLIQHKLQQINDVLDITGSFLELNINSSLDLKLAELVILSTLKYMYISSLLVDKLQFGASEKFYDLSKNLESKYQFIENINLIGIKNQKLGFIQLHSNQINIANLTGNIVYIHIINSKYKGFDINSNALKTSQLYIRNSIINELNLDISDFYNIHINNIKGELPLDSIKLMNFNYINIEKKFNLYDIVVKQLSITNSTFSKDSKVYIRNITVENFTFSNITQSWSEAVFENIIVTGELTLEAVDLQKTKFVNCDFSKAKIKIANNVSITKDTLFNSVKWGNLTRIDTSRDLFRQLKFSNDSQANYIEANHFYSEEMRRYKNELKNHPENFSFEDKLVFWFGEKISNFSQSWLLPIYWFLGLLTIHYLIFLGYENNLLYKIYEPLNPFFAFISQHLNGFAKNILPIKRFLTSGIEFISFIFYIAYTFLIYHLTIALQRNTKR